MMDIIHSATQWLSTEAAAPATLALVLPGLIGMAVLRKKNRT